MFKYNWLIKWVPQLYLPRLCSSTMGPPANAFTNTNMCLNRKMKSAFHFLSQYLRPPLRHPSCCVPAPLTWSSSSTPTLSWEMAPLSGRRLSTAPASRRGQRCMESTWSPISSGTWIQTRSTTSVCCWLGPEREELAHLDHLLWAGPSVPVSFDVLTHCTTGQVVVA